VCVRERERERETEREMVDFQTWYISFNFNDMALNPSMNSSNLK
jgi:hypothetical protein